MTTPTKTDVRATWDTIGPHFAKTRATPWPEVEDFVDTVDAARGLDVGTGNGRHATLLADHCNHVLALDASTELLTIAAEAVPDNVACLAGDAASLPLRDDCIDVALSIATIHHLPTPAARRASITELLRVLTADGSAYLSVWTTTHDTFDATQSFDTTVDWTLPDGTTVERYYHIYTPEDFRALLERTGATIDAFTVSSGNCYATITPDSTR